uniref:Uncharacterized protein n=1 Tax=Micrurus spixii TaxID=129469 RepID=A0A2D4MG62_9SAUR
MTYLKHYKTERTWGRKEGEKCRSLRKFRGAVDDVLGPCLPLNALGGELFQKHCVGKKTRFHLKMRMEVVLALTEISTLFSQKKEYKYIYIYIHTHKKATIAMSASCQARSFVASQTDNNPFCS